MHLILLGRTKQSVMSRLMMFELSDFFISKVKNISSDMASALPLIFTALDGLWLHNFYPVTVEENRQLIDSLLNKQSPLD